MDIAVTLAGLGQALTYVIVGIFFIWLAKRVDDWRTKEFDDDTHIDDGNVAVGLRRGGLYLGIAIALSGAMGGSSSGFFLDVIQLLIDGIIITGFMFSSRFINDLFMLGQRCRHPFLLRGEQFPESLQLSFSHGVPPLHASGLVQGDADFNVIDLECVFISQFPV